MIFAGEMATEMIFAGSCLQGVPPSSPLLSDHSSSGGIPSPCCDLLHSSSHNFIRPDHGPRGTVWQMYPSANFKLVPASPNDGGREGGGDRVSGSGWNHIATRNITNNVNSCLQCPSFPFLRRHAPTAAILGALSVRLHSGPKSRSHGRMELSGSAGSSTVPRLYLEGNYCFSILSKIYQTTLWIDIFYLATCFRGRTVWWWRGLTFMTTA